MKRGAHCRRWQLRQALRLAMRTSAFVPGPVRSAGSAGWWADLQVLECSRAHVFGRAAGARRSDRGQTRKADAEAVRSHLTVVFEAACVVGVLHVVTRECESESSEVFRFVKQPREMCFFGFGVLYKLACARCHS